MKYRTIWLSDLHLGTRGSNSEKLLEFLKDNESDTLYLVGDIIDGWRLTKKFYWPQSHNDVVQKILRKARKGTRVVYIPGNHDEFLRAYDGHQFGGIDIENEYVHETADGKRLWIIHGDQFDGITTHYKSLALLGDWAYVVTMNLNRYFNVIRRKFGLGYWSLSAYLKKKVKEAVNFISSFESSVANECKRQGYDGVVCGHIHHAEIREIDGILYCNDGDGVESCTALVEHEDGRLEIVSWLENGGIATESETSE